MLLMFVVMYVAFYIWLALTEVKPITLEDPTINMERQIYCPDCGNVNLDIEYVNPIFHTGNYLSCKKCGWASDIPETTATPWSLHKMSDEHLEKFVEGIEVDEVEDVENVYQVVKI